MKADKALGKPTSKKPAKQSQVPSASKTAEKCSGKSPSNKPAKSSPASPTVTTTVEVSGKSGSKKPAKQSKGPPTSKTTDNSSGKCASKKPATSSPASPTVKTAVEVSSKSGNKKHATKSHAPPINKTPAKVPDQCLSTRLVRRFYEVLVLLRCLGQVQGEKLRTESLEDANVQSMGSTEMRRRVMYHLCVVCDFERGGDSVTAIASESRPSGPRYWMAANKHVEKIEKFLTEVLGMLEKQACRDSSESEIARFECGLFEKFALFQRTRIKEYGRILQQRMKAELQRALLSPAHQNDKLEYIQWLQDFQHPMGKDQDCLNLSQAAYDTRHSAFVRIEHDPLTGQTTKVENSSRIDIRHYIGRLGAPRRAAAFLAHAAIQSPDLFYGFTVEAITREAPVSTPEEPAEHADLNIDGICKRMFSNAPEEALKFRTALKSLDEKGLIMLRVREQYRSKNWKTRVHAELAVLETLHHRDCTFYDDDKFIACSKAACFCCYHYISAHPGLFERPSCHNKVYLNWCPPSHVAGKALPPNQQRDIVNKLTGEVRKAVIKKVFNAERGSRWHPDSSTGITPSIVPVPELELEKITFASGSVCDSPRSHSSRSFVESDWSEDFDNDDGGVSLGVVEQKI